MENEEWGWEDWGAERLTRNTKRGGEEKNTFEHTP